VREGKHGARSPQQAIAIGLSKARRAGVPLKPPARGKTSEETRHKAEKDYEISRCSFAACKERSAKEAVKRVGCTSRFHVACVRYVLRMTYASFQGCN